MPVRNLAIKAWSYSRLDKYELCPAKLGYDAKGLKEPQGPALAEGERVHKLGEAFVKGRLRTVPKEYANFATHLKRLRRLRFEAEDMWCLTSDWEEAPPYGDPEHFALTWLRVKLDAYGFPKPGLLEIVDYKTGKVNEEKGRDQLRLYAAAGLSLWDVERVHARLWYLDVGHEVADTFDADRLEELQGYWNERARPMLKDRRFSPRPGYYCRWCHYSRTKGGPCRY